MAQFELVMPAMGEGIIEATITRWLVKKGDRVATDQPLVEIATDKVDSEIVSPVEGIVSRLIYHEGEIPKIGEILAIIETNGISASHEKEVDSGNKVKIFSEKTENIRVTEKIAYKRIPAPESSPEQPQDFITPLIRTLAKQLEISYDELLKIKGSGIEGRVTKEDIHKYFLTGRPYKSNNDIFTELKIQHVNNDEKLTNSLPQVDSEDEVIEMDRMRRLIAEHMVRSKKIAPHVTSFAEADITSLVEWRERNKDTFFNREQVKLTFTPLFVEVVAHAIKDFPRMNISVNENTIILKKNINIGVATALADGNLIVPVVRNANLENLTGLAHIISDLASRARENKLQPAEIKGGTFTITNIGQYNNLTGTPIINQPESAILAVGTIQKKPWAVKTSEGYGIAVRDITMLSLTYDHRVIDGALGGSFLSRIVHYLENFDATRFL